jgi:outer membrane protein insertion porin family
MLESRPPKLLITSIATALLVFVLVSCGVIPKNYPKDKPFVFETKFKVDGNFSKEERDALTSQLRSQLDDSMRAKTVYKLLYKGVNRLVLVNPPVFDSASADRSMIFMKALLHKQGYLRDSVSYDTTMDLSHGNPPQLRTIVTFNITPNQLFTIDSISHVINNDELQALTDASKQNTILKKGQPFAQQLISEELNRLVQLYRENGYLKFR